MNSFTRRNVGQMQPQAKTQQSSNMLRPQNMQRGARMAPTGTPINFRANLGTPAQTQSLAQSAGFMTRPIFGPGLPVNPPSQPPSQPPMLMPAPSPPGLYPSPIPNLPRLDPGFPLPMPAPSPPGLYPSPIPNPPMLDPGFQLPVNPPSQPPMLMPAPSPPGLYPSPIPNPPMLDPGFQLPTPVTGYPVLGGTLGDLGRGLSPEMQLQALLEQKRQSELLGNLYFSGLGGLRR